jgi:hypothetical protein
MLLKTPRTLFKDSVRTSHETRYVSTTKPNRLILFRETVAVYCGNYKQHTATFCGQNAEFSFSPVTCAVSVDEPWTQ